MPDTKFNVVAGLTLAAATLTLARALSNRGHNKEVGRMKELQIEARRRLRF